MKLDEESFMLFAAKHYDMAKATGIDEFNDDLKRFQYLKRLFKRYHDEDELKVRLILNHLIVLYNCFGPAATTMLFMKLTDYHKYLKPFILFLHYLPDDIEYDDVKINTNSIPMDMQILRELRKI